MPQRDVGTAHDSLEIVRRALRELRKCYVLGAATEGLLELCAPDIRVDGTRRVFNPGLYEGHAGVNRVIAEICEAWEGFEEHNERLIDVGERVVVVQTVSGRGRVSKALVEQKGGLIWTVRDGLVRHIEIFGDSGEAMKAVGLAE